VLTLWDNPDSSNGLKVRFLLAELGLPHQTHHVPLSRPRPADYLALNPLGGIPTLEDGDLVLTESQAILRYLATRQGRDDLYPSEARERAVVDELLDRFATRLRPAFFRVEAAALGWTLQNGFDPADADLERAREVAEEVAGEVTLLDEVVGSDFACLGRFTIVDCALAPVLHRTFHTGHNLGPFPNLASLRERLLARPAWTAARPGV
jgi:glutathione S-transferase